MIQLSQEPELCCARATASPPLTAMWWFLQIENDFEIIPFDEAQAREALAAFDRYGKGIDPKARLNLSDCAAYALAKTLNAPLLFKGNDFTQTDLQLFR